MSKYEVFFEIYGKKMKAQIEADNQMDAKFKVIEKLIFHDILEIENSLLKEDYYRKDNSIDKEAFNFIKNILKL